MIPSSILRYLYIFHVDIYPKKQNTIIQSSLKTDLVLRDTNYGAQQKNQISIKRNIFSLLHCEPLQKPPAMSQIIRHTRV